MLKKIHSLFKKSSSVVGVVHGRFQPPHNGHIRYIEETLRRVDHVIIGICTPAVCTEEYAARTGYPCTPRFNPYTHEERIHMLQLALEDKGIDKKRYSFVPFPSDYKNLSRNIPKRSILFMSVTGATDNAKIEYLRGQGYPVETVLNLEPHHIRERSGVIRSRGRGWETMVSPSVAEYLKDKK